MIWRAKTALRIARRHKPLPPLAEGFSSPPAAPWRWLFCSDGRRRVKAGCGHAWLRRHRGVVVKAWATGTNITRRGRPPLPYFTASAAR